MKKATETKRLQPDNKKKPRTLDEKELQAVTGGMEDVELGSVIHFPPP